MTFHLVQCALRCLYPDSTSQRVEKATVIGTIEMQLILALTCSLRVSTPRNMPANISGVPRGHLMSSHARLRSQEPPALC